MDCALVAPLVISSRISWGPGDRAYRLPSRYRYAWVAHDGARVEREAAARFFQTPRPQVPREVHRLGSLRTRDGHRTADPRDRSKGRQGEHRVAAERRPLHTVRTSAVPRPRRPCDGSTSSSSRWGRLSASITTSAKPTGVSPASATHRRPCSAASEEPWFCRLGQGPRSPAHGPSPTGPPPARLLEGHEGAHGELATIEEPGMVIFNARRRRTDVSPCGLERGRMEVVRAAGFRPPAAQPFSVDVRAFVRPTPRDRDAAARRATTPGTDSRAG